MIHLLLHGYSKNGFRYPDDIFDRKWDRYNEFETDVNTTLNVRSSSPFQVPEAVSRMGITPENASLPLRFYVSLDDDSDKVNVYFHFAEIQALRGNETREFDIELEEDIIQSAYSPTMLQSDTKYNLSPHKCSSGLCYLKLVRTPRSTLPPLISAIEAFKVVDFPYAETNPNDGTPLFHSLFCKKGLICKKKKNNHKIGGKIMVTKRRKYSCVYRV